MCDDKLSKKKNWLPVKTLGFRYRILCLCHSRLLSCSEDEWACDVKAKLSTCFDLVSAGANYHVACRLSFLNGEQFMSSSSVGRPREDNLVSSFEKTCDWLEHEIEVHTLSEFAAKMKEFSESNESYFNIYIKGRIQL